MDTRPSRADRAAHLIRDAKNIAFLTGAGISTGAGIPDFRGPQGVWTRNPAAELASTLPYYLADAEVRRAAWQMRSEEGIWDARPTPCHLAIAELEKQGRCAGIITQNTDGLHQLAGSSEEMVHEIHGTARWTRCERCRHEQPTWDVILRVREGDLDPHCRRTVEGAECGGILRAATILFEEGLVPEVIDACVQVVERCDLLVTAGTLLSVFPAASLVPLAIANGKPVVIANRDETAYDDHAQGLLRGDLQQELAPMLLA